MWEIALLQFFKMLLRTLDCYIHITQYKCEISNAGMHGMANLLNLVRRNIKIKHLRPLIWIITVYNLWCMRVFLRWIMFDSSIWKALWTRNTLNADHELSRLEAPLFSWLKGIDVCQNQMSETLLSSKIFDIGLLLYTVWSYYINKINSTVLKYVIWGIRTETCVD
jgi:hypothetical protein